MTETNTEPGHDWPRWAALVAAIPPVLIAAVSVLTALDGGDPWLVVAIAVTASLLPWLLSAADVHLPRWLFATWVIVPLALLNVAGRALGIDLSSDGHTQFTLLLLLWLLGEMVATARPVEAAVTAVVVLGIIAGRVVVDPAFSHAAVFWAGGSVIALVTGLMLRIQQRTLSQLRTAQAALAAEAVQRERRQIAREVHDVVAHSMTVTLLHLQAARRALEHDPAMARDTLQEAETLGRRSLSDIRRTVGLLRADDDAPETRALPEASDIPTLVDTYRAAGMTVRDDMDLDAGLLGSAASVGLYRLVQEALSNAAAHAPGTEIDLEVRTGDGEVVLRVSNPLSAGASDSDREGLGLVGMRERVRLLGGVMEVGPRGDRWQVRVRLPVQVAASGTEAVL